MAVLVHQKLPEVPRDRTGRIGLVVIEAGVVLEEREHRMHIRAVHVDFLHHSDVVFLRDVVGRDEFLDVGRVRELLVGKLSARESEYLEAALLLPSLEAVLILLPDLRELGVVGLGEASFGCHVGDEQDLARIVLEVDRGPVECLGTELVKALAGRLQ